MQCPKCHQIVNINEIDNKYFIGRNSDGILFFKCKECGNLFYVNEKEGIAHSLSRGEQGYRFVPILWGIFCWIIALVIFWFLGSNIITWIVGGVFLWLGWSGIKIGIWGSQKLIDEMTLDSGGSSSKEAVKEWRKLNKLD